ncbi:MAG TPA: hypothetical protein VD996_17535 [Chitinophagaceae bacterium]|nr:hypothetical protein [Chitinophagaceae bacterium]
MWAQQPAGRKSRVALQLHENPLQKKITLLINNKVICETSFQSRDERKMILMNWEEKYALFENGRPYCISISS